MGLHGRKALVTGASRGIGYAIADGLLRMGAEVLVTARTMASLEDAMAGWRSEGLAVYPLTCDLTSPDVGEVLREAVETQVGALDILVNNAGMGHAAPLAATRLEDFESVMRVNATSVFLTMKSFLPPMKAGRFGRVVNVASTASLTGTKYTAAYTASKHAVLGLTRCAAAELMGSGVTVNAVCPGFVDTPMTQQTLSNIMKATKRTKDEALAALLKQAGQSRLIQPEEVAHAVMGFVTPEAGAINGQALVIDGGVLLA